MEKKFVPGMWPEVAVEANKPGWIVPKGLQDTLTDCVFDCWVPT